MTKEKDRVTLIHVNDEANQIINNISEKRYYYKRHIMEHILRNFLKDVYSFSDKEQRSKVLFVDKKLAKKVDGIIKPLGYSRSEAIDYVLENMFEELKVKKLEWMDGFGTTNDNITMVRVTKSSDDKITETASRMDLSNNRISNFVLYNIATGIIKLPKREKLSNVFVVDYDLAKASREKAKSHNYVSSGEVISDIIARYKEDVVIER